MKQLCLLIITLLIFCTSTQYTYNRALQFDGVNDLVKVGSVSTDEALLSSWTLEAWIKPDQEQKLNLPNIAGFPNRHPNLHVCGNSTACADPTYLLASLREENGDYFNVIGNKLRVENNKWSHVAASWNNETLIILVNGELDGIQYPYKEGYKNPMYCSGMVCDEGLQIGGFRCCSNYSAQYFKGLIDEVRVWRTGRTQAEVKSTMNHTLRGNETGLAYYWRFDEGYGLLASSLANSGYGARGGGVKNSEPVWVLSDAPIQDLFPMVQETVEVRGYAEEDYSVAVISSAIVAVVMFALGVAVGLYVIPRMRAKNTDEEERAVRPEDEAFN